MICAIILRFGRLIIPYMHSRDLLGVENSTPHPQTFAKFKPAPALPHQKAYILIKVKSRNAQF